jgi:hypothetical protein
VFCLNNDRFDDMFNDIFDGSPQLTSNNYELITNCSHIYNGHLSKSPSQDSLDGLFTGEYGKFAHVIET